MGSQIPSAPWDEVPPHEQLFVLITGANSGIGLSIGERLIDEFLATRSLTSHLILLPTTRSAAKSLQTIRALRTYAERAAKKSSVLRSRVGDPYRWQDATRRIHVLSLQLDLCDLRNVYAFAERLIHATVSNPPGLEGEYLERVKIPRLDSVVFNAAYGGWSGFSMLAATWMMATKGLVQAVTWPTYKLALPTSLLNERKDLNYPSKPLLGEVFAACIFGHYVLAHELLPLLTRRNAEETPGRLIWSSSLEAVRDAFDLADPQCFTGKGPYESSKRLTDIISLTATLPAVKPYATPFFTDDDATVAQHERVPPKMYLTHPGIVSSAIFPVPWGLVWAYNLALIFSRWLGSPWHTFDTYSGAKSPVWVILQEQKALDDLDAERVKWGSSSNRWLEVGIKKTEVEGWGWEGKVEDASKDTTGALLNKAIGRKSGALDVSEDSLVEFEELGVECWKTMEDMRLEWQEVLDVKKA
ncbi:hypothetical protein G7046_g5608 [Stylonectria norvegica]|nr:hypothetical protein G7046_g5608 [Stylonectria norvegica]